MRTEWLNYYEDVYYEPSIEWRKAYIKEDGETAEVEVNAHKGWGKVVQVFYRVYRDGVMTFSGTIGKQEGAYLLRSKIKEGQKIELEFIVRDRYNVIVSDRQDLQELLDEIPPSDITEEIIVEEGE